MREEKARGALTRSGGAALCRVQSVPVHALAWHGRRGRVWARAGLANASLSRARAVHDDDQGGQEILLDKKKVRGGGCGDRWHEGRHGARHGVV